MRLDFDELEADASVLGREALVGAARSGLLRQLRDAAFTIEALRRAAEADGSSRTALQLADAGEALHRAIATLAR